MKRIILIRRVKAGKQRSLGEVALWSTLVFGMILFSNVALAGIKFDIVNPDNGTKLGSLTLPSEFGSTPEGVEFNFRGFSEKHISPLHTRAWDSRNRSRKKLGCGLKGIVYYPLEQNLLIAKAGSWMIVNSKPPRRTNII